MTYQKPYIAPDLRVSFEHKIRKAWLDVDAEAWSDDEGIYRTAIVNVWLDGVEVYDLLTPEDIRDIDDAIIPAICAQDDGPDYSKGDRFQLGD